MATGHSDYHRGGMPVEAQAGTFKGFMGFTVYGGAVIALLVIMPTLVFAVGLNWLMALIITFVIGVILGVALKLKGGWYAGLVALSIVTAIFCIILSVLM